jgi:DNA repair protein RecO (recombination protein O)
MPTISDIAICIRHWDYSETSQTVSLFGRAHGVLRGLAKGSKREKSNFSGGIDLFAVGEVRAIIKPASELANIIEWTLLEAHWRLRDDLAAHRRALYFADLIQHMVRDHDPHPALYDSFARALAAGADPAALESATASFLWSLLCEAGYRPEVERDAISGKAIDEADPVAFDPQAGGIVAAAPGLDRWRLRPETLRALRLLSRGGDDPDRYPEEAHTAKEKATISADAVRRTGSLLSAYIRTILGYEPATLRWVFPELAEKG